MILVIYNAYSSRKETLKRMFLINIRDDRRDEFRGEIAQRRKKYMWSKDVISICFTMSGTGL